MPYGASMSRRPPPAPGASSPPSVSRRFAGEHVGLAVTVGVGLAAATKVVAVAHGDPVTVSALARHLDFGGLLAIVLVSGAPVLGALLGFLGASSLMEAIREEDAIKGPMTAFVLGLVVSFSLAPKGLFVGLLVLAAVMLGSSVGLRILRKRRRNANKPLGFLLRNHPRQISASWTVAVTVAVAVAVVVVSDAPWLPKEHLRSRDGSAQVGYVLAEGDTMTIMDAEDRSVILRPSGEVSERRFCEASVPWVGELGQGRSLLAELLWAETGNYDPCAAIASR